MALSRLNEFNDGTALTETKLEGEFDNIYNNPLTLISPLTGNLDFDGKQAISLVIESGTSNPGSELNEGRLFYRSTMNIPVYYDGSNFQGVGRTVVTLTNKSGGALAIGDVVILDTSNASSVTTTTTAAVTNQPMVALETIANDAAGLFQVAGVVGTLDVAGATSIGDFLTTSTTVKAATGSSTLSDGTFAQALTSTGGAGSVTAIMGPPAKITADLPKGYLDGGAMSNGTDTTNDIDFTAVECRDDGDTVNIVTSSTFTKQLDVEWAVGTGAGGLAAADDPIGGAANLIAWTISKSDGTDSDFFFSTSSSPTLPTGYSVKRQIGWFRWDGSTIEQFDQVGTGRERHHRYRDPIQDVSDSTITANTGETATLIVPPDSLAHVRIYATDTAANTVGVAIYPTSAADDTTQLDESSSATGRGSSSANFTAGAEWVIADSSSQCKYMATEGTATTVIANTLGFIIFL